MQAATQPTGYPSIDKPWLKYYSEDALHAKLPECTMYAYLLESNKDHPDDAALIYFGKKITYGRLFRGIDAAARGFQALGISKGDIVTFCMPTIPETVYALYALNRIGAICNMIDYQTNSQWLIENMRSTGSRYMLALDLCYASIDVVVAETDIEKVIIASLPNSMPFFARLGYAVKMPHVSVDSDLRCMKWRDFIKNGKNADIREPEYEPHTPAAIVYTGGTTGLPKGAVLSNDNINALSQQFRLTFPHFKRGNRFLDIIPPVVPYGLCGGLHTPLVCGMTTIIVPKYEVDKLDALIVKYRPTHFMAVPVCCEYLMQSRRMHRFDLSFLMFPSVGGDSMSPAIEERFNQFLAAHGAKVRLAKGYGLSETSSAVSACTQNYNAIGSVGIPLPWNSISIFKPDSHEELRYGEKGEICVSSPTTMLGYYKNPESTAATVQKHSDGRMWVHTGDYGYMTQDGAIFIIGRMKRMIIQADGYKVYPGPLEAVMAAHRAVAACAVVGMPDPHHHQGMLPKAFLILKEDYQADTARLFDELGALCEHSVHKNAVPCAYQICKAFPYTKVGKVDYRALERMEPER